MKAQEAPDENRARVFTAPCTKGAAAPPENNLRIIMNLRIAEGSQREDGNDQHDRIRRFNHLPPHRKSHDEEPAAALTSYARVFSTSIHPSGVSNPTRYQFLQYSIPRVLPLMLKRSVAFRFLRALVGASSFFLDCRHGVAGRASFGFSLAHAQPLISR